MTKDVGEMLNTDTQTQQVYLTDLEHVCEPF